MKEKYDKDTLKWFEAHPFSQITAAKCEICGLYYKPAFGHRCRKKKKGKANMKKVMISQPMAGKTYTDIAATRKRAAMALNEKGYEVVNSFFEDEYSRKDRLVHDGVEQIPVNFLSKALEAMSRCHAVYFCKGWENARGCKIEHEVAVAYGLEILYE